MRSTGRWAPPAPSWPSRPPARRARPGCRTHSRAPGSFGLLCRSCRSLFRSGYERLYRFFEFFPVLQKGVVAAKCIYLGVVCLRASHFCTLGGGPNFGGGEEPVARDPNEEHLGLDARVGNFLGLVATCHVVEVHRPGEVEVGVGVEAAGELPSLVVQVALDLEPPTELGVKRGTPGGSTAEPLPLSRGALVGHHPRHPGDGESPIGPLSRAVVVAVLPVRVGHDSAASDLAHPDTLRPERPCGGHGYGLLHEVGELYGPLQRLLSTDGTAGNEGQPSHAKGVEQPPLRPDHVPDRDHGKAHPVGSPRAWFCGGRTGAARAASEDVRAHDEVLFGVYGEPWPNHWVPPTAASVPFGEASCGMRVSCQGVDEQDGVVGGDVELAPGLRS